jgi:hypothetical protein
MKILAVWEKEESSQRWDGMRVDRRNIGVYRKKSRIDCIDGVI